MEADNEDAKTGEVSESIKNRLFDPIRVSRVFEHSLFTQTR